MGRHPTAYTRSVFFKIGQDSHVQSLKLEFDTGRVELGGSDVIFFSTLASAGARIFYCHDSHVTEYYDGDRVTLRWWFWRKFRNAQFRFERGELRLVDLVTSFWRVISTLLSYLLGWLFPKRLKTRHSLMEFVGHLLLSAAPPLGIALYRLYRFESYSDKKI